METAKMAVKKNTRKILLESAIEVFNEKGFEKSTIDDIVKHANCGKGTFYRYFTNKEALFKVLDENFISQLQKTLKQYCKSQLDPRTYLSAGLKAFLKVFEINNGIGLIRFEREMRLTEKELRISSHRMLNAFFYMKEKLENEQKRGNLKPINPETILNILIGTAHFFLFRKIKLGISVTEKELEETIDIIYFGVATV
jgi:AcrR family transcriptional regulator